MTEQQHDLNLGRGVMKKMTRNLMSAATVAAVSLFAASSASAVSLKASHQWPGGKGDLRDEMVQMIAKDAASANVDLHIMVYPGKPLYKPKDQWGAIVKEPLDITTFPVASAAARHPMSTLTLITT